MMGFGYRFYPSYAKEVTCEIDFYNFHLSPKYTIALRRIIIRTKPETPANWDMLRLKIKLLHLKHAPLIDLHQRQLISLEYLPYF